MKEERTSVTQGGKNTEAQRGSGLHTNVCSLKKSKTMRQDKARQVQSKVSAAVDNETEKWTGVEEFTLS